MTLITELNSALKQAMLAKDDSSRNTLRLLLSAIKLAEVEKGSPIDDAAIFSLIQKEIKMRKESIEGAQKADRTDLIDQANIEISILEAFLPKGLSAQELNDLVKSAIADSGATGPSDTGKVMKVLMPIIQGRAPGDVVSKAVRDLLQA